MANPTGSKTKQQGALVPARQAHGFAVGRSAGRSLELGSNTEPREMVAPACLGEQNSAYAGRNPNQIGGESSAGFAADFFYRPTHLTHR